MSNTTTPTPDPDARPWHGAESPWEALYQHFEAKIAAAGKALVSSDEVASLKAEIVALEGRVMAALKPPAPKSEPAAPIPATPPAT